MKAAICAYVCIKTTLIYPQHVLKLSGDRDLLSPSRRSLVGTLIFSCNIILVQFYQNFVTSPAKQESRKCWLEYNKSTIVWYRSQLHRSSFTRDVMFIHCNCIFKCFIITKDHLKLDSEMLASANLKELPQWNKQSIPSFPCLHQSPSLLPVSFYPIHWLLL